MPSSRPVAPNLESPSPAQQPPHPELIPALRLILISTALLYALFAGLRTVPDFDLGWQMATGRYLLTHHAIPRTELFSYTAHGVQWIYPVLSCLILYLLHQLGGYAAISWLCALTCVACTAILIYRRSLWAIALALFAVPVLASEIMPRASLFTILLFTCFARILLQHLESSPIEASARSETPPAKCQSPLWLLPPLMVLWVNLHPGFIAGLALIAAYLVAETLETPFAARRRPALLRVRRALPWLLATIAATLLNPWGVRIFAAITRQQSVTQAQSAFLEEWSPVRWAVALQNLGWRDSASAVWWLLGFGILLALVCLWQRQLGASLVLLAAVCAFLHYQRMEGPCIVLICLIGGAVLSKAETETPTQVARIVILTRPWVRISAVALVTALAAVRSFDLVTNRTYLSSGALTLFGAGPSWSLPTQAADFLLKNRLPANVFSSFNLSSYLVWQLEADPADQPPYLDFADGRYVPFGTRLFDQQRLLTSLPLDAPEWTQAADTYHIRTVIFPLARILALGELPLLADCDSEHWTPVYMDTAAIIFVLNDAKPDGMADVQPDAKPNLEPAQPPSAALRHPPAINCHTQNLLPIAAGETSDPQPQPSRAQQYQLFANASAIYSALGRYPEAEAAANLAANRFPGFSGDPTLHTIRAQIALGQHQYALAENDLRAALAIRQTDAAWYNLGLLYLAEQRLPEAVDALQRSARLSPEDYQRHLLIARIRLAQLQPQPALEALARATRESPYSQSTTPEAAEFNAELFEQQANAYLELHQPQKAVALQLSAVRQTPANLQRRQALARACQAANIQCPLP
jgi:tetratricopeptide (TPR) repeat protein